MLSPRKRLLCESSPVANVDVLQFHCNHTSSKYPLKGPDESFILEEVKYKNSAQTDTIDDQDILEQLKEKFNDLPRLTSVKTMILLYLNLGVRIDMQKSLEHLHWN